MYKENMWKIKKILGLFLVWIMLFSFFVLKTEAKEATTVYLFYGDWCPHCAREEGFLQELQAKRWDFEIKTYEIWYDKNNRDLLSRLSKVCWTDVSGVPFTLIGEETIVGFWGKKTTGKKIISAIENCEQNVCRDLVKELDKKDCDTVVKNEVEENQKTWEGEDEKMLDLPFFWSINLKNFSLPIITIIIGTLDWFNPCAMWILLFLISMLIGMKSKPKMWILGGTFIFVSALVYFFFMTTWLNLIEFLWFITWIRTGIWLFALLWWWYNIYQYIKSKKTSWCTVVSDKKRKKIFEKIKNIVHEKTFWIALIGISILAVSVNLIELLCSAWLPVVFTQILEVNNLLVREKYLYIILYVFFFMLDDLLVFFISIKTLELTWITTKYTRYNHVVWGVLMLIIGILLILKPELLMFG